MSNLPVPVLLLLLGLTLGCPARALADPSPAHPDESAHAHDASDNSDDGVTGITYHPGSGLTLATAVLTALNVQTAVVSRQAVTHRRQFTGQAYRDGPETLVCLQVPASEADALAAGTFLNGRLRRVDRSATTATSWVDFIVAPAPGARHSPGDFVTVTVEWRDTPPAVIPASALLATAAGSFVYVRHDASWLRTPVTAEASVDDSPLVAVSSGLRPGEVVLVAPVEQFWLAELRLTKGGGHSH